MSERISFAEIQKKFDLDGFCLRIRRQKRDLRLKVVRYYGTVKIGTRFTERQENLNQNTLLFFTLVSYRKIQ